MKHLTTVRRRRTHSHPRRGQGMTEYIIIVGLIALGLLTAVNQYSFRVDEAIQGTTGAMNNRVTGQMNQSIPPASLPDGQRGTVGTTTGGHTVTGEKNGNSWTNLQVNGQPYNPQTHGQIQ